MQQGYKARFFDDLQKNLRSLEDKITVDEEEHITKSLKNTCLFAKVLHNTFNDAGDVVGMLLMATACDYSPMSQIPGEPVKVERIAETGEVVVSPLE